MQSSASPISVTPLPSIAGPAVRFFAVVYDFLLIAALVLTGEVILTVIGTWIFGQAGSGKAQLLPAWYSYGVMFPFAVFTIWSFYAVFWAKAGQTLGMQTWNLKVVTADGKLLPHSLGYFRCAMASLLPALTALVSYVVFHSKPLVVTSFFVSLMLNNLFALTNARRMALQDLLSGTVVLKLPSPKLKLFGRKKTG